MLAMKDKPTVEDCIYWKDALNGEWGDMDTEQESEEKLYRQEFGMETPGGKFAVKTGSAPSDADSAIDIIMPDAVLARVRPARGREKYRKQADQLQRLARALMHQWRGKKDTLRLLATDQVIRRVAVARVLTDMSQWAKPPDGLDSTESEDGGSALIDWQIRNRRVCPITLERRNPRHVRWRQDDRGDFIAVVEHYPTTAAEARLTYGRFPETRRILKSRQANERVWVSDIWVGAWRCLLLDDLPLFPGKVLPHGYEEIPYVVAPFRELPFDEPHWRYKGMLTNAAGLYPLESQVLSMMVSMLAWNAWRTYVGWTRDGRDVAIIPGQYISIDKRIGEYLELLGGDPVPPEVLQVAHLFDGYIQRNGVAQGPTTSEGTRSGSQLWAVQAMRQLKVEAAKEELVRLVNRSLYLATQQIETVLRPDALVLPVPGKDRDGNDYGEVTIRPQDINGYWDGWEVSFGKRLDPALLEQAKALMALSANNWMPLKASWEMSGLVDVPTEWEDELYLQSANRLPFMIEMAAMELIAGTYGADSWQFQTFRQKLVESKMQQQQGGAGGAMPGSPGMGGGGTMQPPSPRGPMIGPAQSPGSGMGVGPKPGGYMPKGRTGGGPKTPAGAPAGM